MYGQGGDTWVSADIVKPERCSKLWKSLLISKAVLSFSKDHQGS